MNLLFWRKPKEKPYAWCFCCYENKVEVAGQSCPICIARNAERDARQAESYRISRIGYELEVKKELLAKRRTKRARRW